MPSKAHGSTKKVFAWIIPISSISGAIEAVRQNAALDLSVLAGAKPIG